MTTFKVDDVKRGEFKVNTRIKSKDNLKALVGLGMEASSMKDSITCSTNNFLAAINMAYDEHLPLTLSPDMIWLAVAQGLSLHINNNAEELRKQFVDFEGKTTIEVFENSFRKGSADNDWSHCFGQFSDAIKDYIGKKRDLIVGEYSTTGAVEKAANEIVLMEAMQQYFNYECTTMCGIPEITLLGTKEDWGSIRDRVQAISEFNLSWWTEKLMPIMDEFVLAASGKPNKSFWQNIYKESGGSGGPYISGWSTNFFPYLKNYRDASKFSLKNEFKTAKMFDGFTTGSFPTGLSKVPFIWNYYDEKFNMELVAGFTGFSSVDGAILPNIGWAVRDTEAAIKIRAKFEYPKDSKNSDWDGMRKFRDIQLAKLKVVSFDIQENASYGKVFYGSIPKNKFDEAAKIEGLEVSLWEEGKSRSDDY